MSGIEQFTEMYQTLLYNVAKIAVHTLELIGILIIVVGSVRAIVIMLSRLRKKQPVDVMVNLGRSLALALGFKIGAEIVNTVIVRDLKELGILAIVIALRTILAFLIRWEINNERMDLLEKEKRKNEQNDEDQ